MAKFVTSVCYGPIVEWHTMVTMDVRFAPLVSSSLQRVLTM